MFSTNGKRLPLWRSIALAGVVFGAAIIAATTAMAGECPADQVGVDVTPPGATEPKDVTDMVIGYIDLAEQIPELAGAQLRLRLLEIQPGGIVPWHSHAERPAVIYVLNGNVTEYSSNCAVPIEHGPGDVSPETAGVSHWWKNNGEFSVRLLSADILRTGDNHVM